MGKFILVPSGFNIQNGQIGTRYGNAELNPIKVEVHGTVLPVILGDQYTQVHIPQQHATVTPDTSRYSHVNYDPFYEYLDWYTEGTSRWTRQVSYDEISMKLWKRNDLSDWVEENCSGYVIARQGYSHVDLGFSEHTDEQKFYQWWTFHAKKFLIKIDGGEDVYSREQEVLQWCRANLKYQYDLRRYGPIHLFVKDEDEAVMAKLYWSGVS